MYIFIILLNENTVTTSQLSPWAVRLLGAETIAVHQIVKLSNVTWIRHTLNKQKAT